MNIFHAFDQVFHDAGPVNLQDYQTQSNILGGEHLLEDGQQIGTSRSNGFGGHDYTIDGQQFSTRENIYGGEDVFENGQKIASTRENPMGGEEFYGADNQHLATVNPDIFDPVHTLYGHAEMVGRGAYEVSNIDAMLGFADPLAHVDNYIPGKMIF